MIRAVISRELRIPLFVPVDTEPELPGCFSTNVSSLGVGLVCGAGVEMQKGARGNVAFLLPGSNAPMRATGEVMWVYGRSSRVGRS